MTFGRPMRYRAIFRNWRWLQVVTEDEHSAEDGDALARRRVSCLITYLSPFRMIESDELSAWATTIDQVNRHAWDYQALHEMAGGIDVGLPSPFHLIVARDGALALPPIAPLHSDQAATEFFNRCLAALLIGGVYCEAVTPDGLDTGSVIDWRYIRSSGRGQAAPNRFHKLIRYQQASALEAIALHRPRTIKFDDLRRALGLGLKALDHLPAVRGEYLLKGTTGIARRDWGAALANLWIVVEQLISELWKRDVLDPTLAADKTKSRRNQLSDTRTWTVSARIEMLFQKESVSQQILDRLNVARKARNDLSHEGKHPSEADAKAAYEGVCGLLRVALSGQALPLFDINLDDHSLTDPFAPPQPLEGEPEFWMEIPKLPGEAELEKAEAQVWGKRRSKRKPITD